MGYRRYLLLLILAAFPAQAQPAEPHAIVNGKSVALSDIEPLVGTLPLQLRGNPDEIFRYYGFIDRMAAKAEAAKLPEQSPYKEQIELQRKQLLAQAEMDQFYKNLDIPDAELHQYYDEHKADFTTASVQSLLIPVKAPDEAAAAKAKARDLAAKLKAGTGVDSLLVQYPSHLESVRRGDSRTDPAIRTAVFALKPGEVSPPVVQPNGIYVFRLQSISTPELQDARSEVWRALADARFAAWMAEVRNSVTVTK